MLRLTVTNGHFEGVTVEVSDTLAIGRSHDSGLFIPDPQVSRKHSRIFLDGDRYWIVDEGSHNGTFLNEVRTEGKRTLRHGDVVRVGNTQLAVDLTGFVGMQAALRMEDDAKDVALTLERSAKELAPPSLEALASDPSIEGFNFPSLSEIRTATDRSLSMIVANAKRFATLFHVARSLQESTDTERLLANMLDRVFKVVDADRGDIVLVHPETGEVKPILSMDRRGHLSDTVRISRTVMRRVLNSMMAVISTDAPNDPRLDSSESIIMYGMRSIMCVPLICKDKVVGLIQLVNERDFAAFSEDDLYLVTVIAALAAVSVENARLYERQRLNIEELRKAHEDLLRTQQELLMQERMATVGQTAAGFAHEIRNSLAPMTLVHLLQEKYPDDSETQDHCQIILEAHKRIQAIVEELRKYTQGTTSLEAGSLIPGRLDEPIQDAIRFLGFDREVKRHALELVVEDSPTVLLDSERIKQVVVNLVRNSAQAITSADGHILVRLRRVAGQALIQIEDNGVGISPDHMDRIWEPFFSTKPGVGMGLGLDISRKIVEQHGGRIECRSKPGQGTVMIVYLPIAAGPGPTTQPIDPASSFSPTVRAVPIVDPPKEETDS